MSEEDAVNKVRGRTLPVSPSTITKIWANGLPWCERCLVEFNAVAAIGAGTAAP